MKAEENSTRLRDVIKAIRFCKTAAEERTVISEESARIRLLSAKKTVPFFHMLVHAY